MKLVDTDMNKGLFTWKNKRGGEAHVASKLDKFLATENFIGKDIFYEEKIILCLGSNHWPIKLEIAMNHHNQNISFRFEALWLREPTFIDKMKNWWKEIETGMEGRNKMHTLQLRLKELKGR